MTTALDTRLHATPIEAAIKTLLPATVNTYDYSTVPGSNGNAGALPVSFVIVSVERAFGADIRSSANAPASRWRVSVRAVSTTINNVSDLTADVTTALNEKRIAVDGKLTTPLQIESHRADGFDASRYSETSIFTYSR